MSSCAKCGADVMLKESASGGEIALNPEPQPLGMLYLDENGVVRPWDALISRGVLRYQSHLYVCPNATEAEVDPNEA